MATSVVRIALAGGLLLTAQILAEQKAKGGDWITAAGRYHRPVGANPQPATAAHLPNTLAGSPAST